MTGNPNLEQNTFVVVQARMGSERLPGKTMKLLGGRPMLAYLIETILTRFPADRIALVTSRNPENRVIREYASKRKIWCYSGSEQDVASRYLAAIQQMPEAGYFFRICGDTPYYDPELFDTGHKEIRGRSIDFVSSMPNRGYPMGCNLELFRSSLFEEQYKNFDSAQHKEHVTSFFYERLDEFDHKLVSCQIPGYNYDDYKFSVDTTEDFEMAAAMLARMNYEPWRYSLEEKFDLQKSIKTTSTLN